MTSPLAPHLKRSLAALRARDQPLSVAELARRLLSLTAAPPGAVGRRLVATALGHEASELPPVLAPAQLRPAAEARLADTPLARAEFVVVDLETTGVAREAAILEIGAVRVSALGLRDRFSSLVRPPTPVPPRISALTGIADADAAEAPPPGEVIPAFWRWLGRSPGAVFVAHNAAFDARFVEAALAEHGLPGLAHPVLCTCKLARRVVPGLPRFDLDHLCAAFGIENRARHRALGDAEATARALLELLAGAVEREVRTLGALLDLQTRPLGRRRSRKVGARHRR